MYIWRQQTRRDRRQHLLSGPADWGPSKEAKFSETDDDNLQYEGERKHVAFFRDKIRVTMHEYLNTAKGKEEIELIILELEKQSRIRQDAEQVDADAPLVPEEMKKKKTIHEIFRKYDADGSDSIDKNEIRILLNDLNIKMKDKEFNELIQSLDSDGGGEIEFEEFYNCNWTLMPC